MSSTSPGPSAPAAAPPLSGEAFFQILAEHTNDIIVRADLTGRLTYISPACRIFGLTQQELLGVSGVDMVHPEDLPHFLGNLALLVAGHDAPPPRERQHRFRTRDGWVWLEGNPRVLRDAEGRPVEILNVFRDVGQQRAELELFETSFRYAPIGQALVGPDGAFLKVNEAFCRMVGYPEAEILSLSFQVITHPQDLEADLRDFERLTAGEIDSYQMDKRYIRGDGGEIWARLSVSCVRIASGEPGHYIAQIQDLTAERLTQTALRESEQRYRVIAENTSDMIVTTDLEGAVTYISAASRMRTGRRREELIGECWRQLIHPEDVEQVVKAFSRIYSSGRRGRVRWRLQDSGRTNWIWFESNPSLLRDADGAPCGFLDVIRDVTDQVAQEQALSRARAEAEAATAVKAKFLANMSHEIRTPLTAVLGFTGLLAAEDDLSPTAREFVGHIGAASRGLLALVNDVLDFSKLEAGQFEIRRAPADPAEVCRETLVILGPQAQEKGLSLALEVSPGVPEALLLDPDRLRQMMLNLVGNAVKFTDAGGVTVRLAFAVDEARLRVEVQDTGPGLASDQRAKLFQRFSQVDAAFARKHGGTGLGLAICKGLAEAMGGEIGVATDPGQGSTFFFTLAAEPAVRAVAAHADETIDLRGLDVLVVDDNPMNRELARRLLEALGAAVTLAGSGQAGLDAALSRPFDVVLMDLRMPDVNGDVVVDAIRSQAGPNRKTPVLAFTADADLSSLAGTTLSRFDGVVRKPIEPTMLAEAIAAAARDQAA